MNYTVREGKILIPKDVDYGKWAVIACDQFTAQPEYWKKLEEKVGNLPSTLRLMYPEIFLGKGQRERIESIHSTMSDYLSQGLFEELSGMVLVEREVDNGLKRIGLVACIDLEKYDYRRIRKEIRATEKTIVDRLPIRVEIRRGAKLEFPHIVLLVDDNENNIIRPLYENRHKLRKLYDFELNMGGGHIRGYQLTDTASISMQFERMLDPELQIKKYGKDAGIQLVVGDGNHSVAAAKEYWNEIKRGLTEEEKEEHPARFLLAEIVNLYDEAMIFEPIHRVVFGAGEGFVEELKGELSGLGAVTLVTREGDILLNSPKKSSETIKKVQSFLERKAENDGVAIEYVHGTNHVREVVEKEGAIGILLPTFQKEELFRYVVNVGNLPQKAFSIGSAEHKKYYLEGKRIER